MKTLSKIMICSVILGMTACGSPVASDENTSSSDLTAENSVTLTHVTTHELPMGTHRPEILVADNGDIYVLVVQPSGSSSGEQIKHQGYHYDSDWNLIGKSFVVTTVTDQYGDPSDHRALIVDDKIVVIYQTNVWEGGSMPQNVTGPMEDYSLNQSLMMAQFSLDGKELSRVPIVANAEPGSGENFPDHAMVWHDGHLYITTGTGEQTLKIREVDLDGTIVSTHEYDASPMSTIHSDVGNSMYFDAEGHLVLVSGNGPDSTDSLLLTTFDSDGNILSSVRLPSDGREEIFPTGNVAYDGLELIGYISRAAGGEAMDFSKNPYSPYLKVLDGDKNVLLDEQVGENGELHVHPMLAVSGDTIYFAWSTAVTQSGNTHSDPQVRVEEYTLSQ